MKAYIEISGCAEVVDVATGKILKVHEVGDRLLVLTQEQDAALIEKTKALLLPFTK
ncbi:hypothetical protein [Cupriavidus sp. TMH.W2]|uniref:hypothetical protein n=1 Tax=Cupriavidus sp. TMH.W2 TaxID=3434465 RepID=UPI003D7722DB